MPLFLGWNSVESAAAYAKGFTYAGWAALFLLGIFEILAHVYSTHKDTLVALHERSTKEASDSQITELKNHLKQQSDSVRTVLSATESIHATTAQSLSEIEQGRRSLESQAQSIESQRQSVEALAKRTERRDRVLTEEQANKLYEAMRAFPGQRFWIITETSNYDKGSEQMLFSDQLSRILIAAGWANDQYPTANPKLPLPLYRSVTTSGIDIGYLASDESQLRVAKSLSESLGLDSVDSKPQPYSDLSKALLITIGLR